MTVRDLTVFLAGRECPWACVFCDLWRYTTDTPTPPGAIPAQLHAVLEAVDPLPGLTQLKLYNASNHFDERAIPEADDAEIARLAKPFWRVVVESHPKLVGPRALRFAEKLEGRLQIAMGLETVHPHAQPQLGKGADLDDYARAADALIRRGLSWRAFVLVGTPFVAPEEDTHWVGKTAQWAIDHGAEHVALIPVRGGNGTLEHLAATRDWSAPDLGSLEDALDTCLALDETAAVVNVDLWDLDSLEGGCLHCRPRRHDRLARINRTGLPEPRLGARCC